mgnify:CR=1 FL=1
MTEQWASDFLRLYPGANILAATKKDFEPANRKKFCSRIATGDYDAVIIGHSQFEKIPLSQERQVAIIERQIDEIELAIAQAKADNGERYTIKHMEKSRKSLLTRLEKLNDASRKDNVVTLSSLAWTGFSWMRVIITKICSSIPRCEMWQELHNQRHRSPRICLQSVSI